MRQISLLLPLAIALAACGTLARQPASPPPVTTAINDSFEGEEIRYAPLEDLAKIQNNISRAFTNESPECYTVGDDGKPVYNYLAVSGGGSDGAFGAGMLNGWTKAGTRPRFKIVTGVSTGGLIAPFAFLGPDYDDELRLSYTTIDASRVFELRGLLPLLWSESFTSTAPLRQLIDTYIDDKVLKAIAIEHAKGRRLFIASTNLDNEQPVIWDMGAIASSKSKHRLELFRKVLLASAAIPSLFPPVIFDVARDGKKYQELHVDGGVVFQSFFVGSSTDLQATIRSAHPDWGENFAQNLYVIRNGWVNPVFQPVERGLTSITSRAILSMFKMSGVNDLWRLYFSSRDDNVLFHYTAIPADYTPSTTQQFDNAEMNREFKLGEKIALDGIQWVMSPPGYAGQSQPTVPPEQAHN
ncbi:MAG: patatin-like phospholipase family protein [Proteobacteria bacterium]|nr:patatin-like phospholipase family protein [Pseudomonadota bacterium]